MEKLFQFLIGRLKTKKKELAKDYGKIVSIPYR